MNCSLGTDEERILNSYTRIIPYLLEIIWKFNYSNLEMSMNWYFSDLRDIKFEDGGEGKNRNFIRGCQIFLGKIYQKGENNTKLP
jgi:hypothetical protein